VDYTNWDVHDEPVLDIIPGDGYESKAVVAGSVLYEDYTFKMWYDALGSLGEFSFCYAEVEMDSTCLAGGYTVGNQQWIDMFPSNYAYCNNILGDLTISGNDITNFNGLSQVAYIDGDLEVYTNPVLESFSGFDNLMHIGDHFKVLDNATLSSLDGLESLNGVAGDLLITMNPALEDIEGIANVDTSTLQTLTITDNENLSWCAVSSVCEFIMDPNHEDEITISGNTGQCLDFNTVFNICFVDVFEVISTDRITITPNPFSQSVNITMEIEKAGYTELAIYNNMGRLVANLLKGELGKGEHQVSWNGEGFPAGMYFCVLRTEFGTKSVKLIKLE
jgi:hypothetical protein